MLYDSYFKRKLWSLFYFVCFCFFDGTFGLGSIFCILKTFNNYKIKFSTILVIFITMMQLLKFLVYWLVGYVLSLFSFINRLICSIRHNNHQISCILKIFYDDMYFYVCIKIIFIISYIYNFNSENDICILKLLVVLKNICLSLKL